MAESAYLPGTLDEEDHTYYNGDLVTESHKDNDAIICDDCGTSAVQLW